jgi:hypothetical protein
MFFTLSYLKLNYLTNFKLDLGLFYLNKYILFQIIPWEIQMSFYFMLL